jgi:flagellar biosynthesis anti-sigma factor FlgM
MKIGTQLKAVRVNLSWHEFGQLKQQCNARQTPWENRISSSENAAAMQHGMFLAMRVPEICTHRVEELRAQIEAGTYQIDSMALARKILDALNPS